MKKDPKGNWIKLNRAIMDDWIWTDGNNEPFDKRSAWIDLLMLAYDKDTFKVHKGQIVEIKRGQVPYSKEFLANRWRWSRGKVDRFLLALKRDKKCAINSTTHGTTITIENYAKWQGERATNSTTNRSTGGQQTIQQADTEEELIEELIEEGAFVPPSAAEVFSFFEDNGFESDPKQFYRWYELNQWTKKNGEPIGDWRLMAISWDKREKQYAEERKGNNGNGNAPAQIEPPKYPEFESEPEIEAEPADPELMAEMKKKLTEAIT